jgi:hypothetical protein
MPRRRSRRTSISLSTSVSGEVPQYTWDDLYKQWTDKSRQLDSLALQEAQFLQVQVLYPPDNAHSYPVDWWPKPEIQTRIAFYSRPRYTDEYHTKAGTFHTAYLLHQAKNDIEQQQAIYILASLRDKEKELPHQWHGEPYRVLREVWKSVWDHFPDFNHWHHASKQALPIELFNTYWRAAEMFVPHDAADLMYIAALEASLSVANWQLIEFVEETAPNIGVIK